MSKLIKAKQRILAKPRDYTYSEARVLLGQLGYKEFNAGKTSGSRVFFYRETDGHKILLHKPHPGDVMSPGAIDDLCERLKNQGDLEL